MSCSYQNALSDISNDSNVELIAPVKKLTNVPTWYTGVFNIHVWICEFWEIIRSVLPQAQLIGFG